MFSEMRYREQAATSDVIEARVRSLQLKVMVGERWWLKLELGGIDFGYLFTSLSYRAQHTVNIQRG
jgi:hypothetical protein